MNGVGNKGSSETCTLSSWCAQACSRSVIIIEMLIQWVRGVMHIIIFTLIHCRS